MSWPEILRKRLPALAFLTAFVAVGFLGLDYALLSRAPHDVATAWDAKIPLSPGWVWIYVVYYPMCFLPLLMPGVLSDDRLFAQVIQGCAGAFIAAYAVYLVFPTRFVHAALPGKGASLWCLRLIYRVDPGCNLFPSMHVAIAVFVAALAWRLWPKALSIPVAAFMALVCASTVLVKQHYLLDIPSGALIGLLGAAVALRSPAPRGAAALAVGAARDRHAPAYAEGLRRDL